MCVGGTRRWLPLGLESVFVGLFKIIYAEPLPPPLPHSIAQTKLNGMYPEGVMAHTISGIFDTVLILL